MNTLILWMWVLSLVAVIASIIEFDVSSRRHRKSLISIDFAAGAAILNILLAPFILIERLFPDIIFIIATTIFALIVLATITGIFLVLKSQNSKNSGITGITGC